MRLCILNITMLLSSLLSPTVGAKDLVAYFSAEGHTKAVAERIAALTEADLYRIEAAEPYAANPYDDSERIQREAYRDLRPAVANPPSQEWVSQYDRIFIGSPCWWHQPAMVVCTFLESYDLSKAVIIPFITYGATTYLNESMQKLYRCTPRSVHVPATLPEDLDADDITRPGRPDDAGIDMPGNAAGVEDWLKRLGLIDDSGVGAISGPMESGIRVHGSAGLINVQLDSRLRPSAVALYNLAGTLLGRMSGRDSYSFAASSGSVYIVSLAYGPGPSHANFRIAL